MRRNRYLVVCVPLIFIVLVHEVSFMSEPEGEVRISSTESNRDYMYTHSSVTQSLNI